MSICVSCFHILLAMYTTNPTASASVSKKDLYEKWYVEHKDPRKRNEIQKYPFYFLLLNFILTQRSMEN